MQLLLLSSSRAGNSEYLAPNLAWIQQHLGDISEVLFIPYAAITTDYDHYLQMVQHALHPLGVKVTSLHQAADPVQAIQQAPALMVGGGNTFHLLYQLYQQELLAAMQARVMAGIPYIGWSAGSNIAGLTICTTNDMPVIEPPSFKALSLLPVQLNPHYTDFKPEGFHGETRDMRLQEFMKLHPSTPILALPEGTALKRVGDSLVYLGEVEGYLMLAGQKTALLPNADLSAFV